mgnify:CR=1 FL=1
MESGNLNPNLKQIGEEGEDGESQIEEGSIQAMEEDVEENLEDDIGEGEEEEEDEEAEYTIERNQKKQESDFSKESSDESQFEGFDDPENFGPGRKKAFHSKREIEEEEEEEEEDDEDNYEVEDDDDDEWVEEEDDDYVDEEEEELKVTKSKKPIIEEPKDQKGLTLRIKLKIGNETTTVETKGTKEVKKEVRKRGRPKDTKKTKTNRQYLDFFFHQITIDLHDRRLSSMNYWKLFVVLFDF